MDAFLSHNRHDKSTARRLGVQLQLAGAHVWFDDWEVRAGDSIPGKINEALTAVDSLVLIWSANAQRSAWVRAEMETAISRAIEDHTLRVITVKLDDTPLPALLRPLKWVDLSDDDIARAVNEIMGFANDQDRLRAIQETFDKADIDIRYFEGYGPVVCCPRCRAGVDHLRGWSQVDYERDHIYAGFRCEVCGLEDGGEV